MNLSTLRRLALTVVAILFLSGPSRAAEPPTGIEADSRITGVVVYEDSAIVTREATVELATGVQAVRFAGLPESVNPNLLQVSAAGVAKATILDVIAYETQLGVPANVRLREIQDQQQALAAEIAEASDRVKLLEQQRDYLERIKAVSTTHSAGDNPPPLPTLDQWEKQLAFYAERQAKLAEELRAARRLQEEKEKHAELLERQEQELEAPEKKTVKNVIVRCEVMAPGRLTMRVSYPVDEASWEPTYDVRVASADKSIVLGSAAMVRQSTGEDWRGVQLQLSSARPALGGKPPVFQPWVVRERPAPVVLAKAVSVVNQQFLQDTGATTNKELLVYTANTEVGGVQGNFAGVGDTGGTGKAAALKAQLVEKFGEEAGTTAASVEEGLGSAIFTIPYPADVPADNGARKYVIGTAPLEGVMNHLAQPKLSPHTFLRARVTNAAEFPLSQGDVNIYLDGAFVASSSMPTVMPGAKFVLNLGVDSGIVVKRKLVNRLTQNTGSFSKRARITYEVQITAENNRKTAETVIVKDQLPISRHEKIVVTMVSPAAADIRPEADGGDDGVVRKDEDGVLSWTLKLQPGEKRTIPLKFYVEYPTDFPVSGLE